MRAYPGKGNLPGNKNEATMTLGDGINHVQAVISEGHVTAEQKVALEFTVELMERLGFCTLCGISCIGSTAEEEEAREEEAREQEGTIIVLTDWIEKIYGR